MVSLGTEMHEMMELGCFDHKYGRLNGGLGHSQWDSGNNGLGGLGVIWRI